MVISSHFKVTVETERDELRRKNLSRIYSKYSLLLEMLSEVCLGSTEFLSCARRNQSVIMNWSCTSTNKKGG